jgi:DNA-binding LacI/PurR family transcriptional regulator/biotin operon repressor
MAMIRILSAVEQVAGHLREDLLREHWTGLMPGVDRLAVDLGVSRKTVEAALQLLEKEGLLVPQGGGRRRKIELPAGAKPTHPLRVAILLSERIDQRLDYIVELQHKLSKAGHAAFFPAKSLTELGMDPQRVARMVAETAADAWVVLAGSREVLRWFAEEQLPTLALFGRRRGLPLAGAGPDKAAAFATAARTLIHLGHRRIVLLARPRRRLPQPGASEQAFLDELAAHGLSVSSYHLPGWEESIRGFHGRLNGLFQVTPPTALIVEEAPFFAAAQQFLSLRKLRVPQDVSLVCTDADPTFEWCQPPISHICWESRPLVRRIVRWAANVSQGKKDIRQTLTQADFVQGGTIGPAAK